MKHYTVSIPAFVEIEIADKEDGKDLTVRSSGIKVRVPEFTSELTEANPDLCSMLGAEINAMLDGYNSGNRYFSYEALSLVRPDSGSSRWLEAKKDFMVEIARIRLAMCADNIGSAVVIKGENFIVVTKEAVAFIYRCGSFAYLVGDTVCVDTSMCPIETFEDLLEMLRKAKT